MSALMTVLASILFEFRFFATFEKVIVSWRFTDAFEGLVGIEKGKIGASLDTFDREIRVWFIIGEAEACC